MQLYLIYLSIYIIILIGITYYVSRKDKDEDYLISGRNRPWYQILFSKFASAIGIAWFITYTAYAYQFGLSMFLLFVGYLVGYWVFAFWAAPRIAKFAKQRKFYTIGDFAYSRISSNSVKNMSNYLAIANQFMWSIIGFVGGAKIMEYFGIFSYESALIITFIVVLAYLFLAGHKAVVITDLIQGFIIIILVTLLTITILGETSLSQILSVETPTIGIGGVIGFLLWGIFSAFSTGERYQLSYAAKDEKDLKKGMFYPIIPITFVGFLLLIIGLVLYTSNPNLDPDLAFIHAMSQYLSPSLLALGFVLFFAGLMSSADSGLYMICSHISLSFREKNSSPVKKMRFTLISISLLMFLISYFFRDIIAISILAGAVTLILSMPMVYLILNGKKSKTKFFASVYFGIFGVCLGILIMGLDPAAAVFVLGFGALGLLWPSKT